MSRHRTRYGIISFKVRDCGLPYSIASRVHQSVKDFLKTLISRSKKERKEHDAQVKQAIKEIEKSFKEKEKGLSEYVLCSIGVHSLMLTPLSSPVKLKRSS